MVHWSIKDVFTRLMYQRIVDGLNCFNNYAEINFNTMLTKNDYQIVALYYSFVG